MNELCLLIVGAMKVLVVIAIVWLMAWGGVAGFQWWGRKKNDDGYWDMWRKWLYISMGILGLIALIYVVTPVTVCKPPDTINIPYYGQ
jgi:predicted membrane channel-forming protein YqfA (hemolysin III family)